jgi:hypothetical protein
VLLPAMPTRARQGDGASPRGLETLGRVSSRGMTPTNCHGLLNIWGRRKRCGGGHGTHQFQEGDSPCFKTGKETEASVALALAMTVSVGAEM